MNGNSDTYLFDIIEEIYFSFKYRLIFSNLFLNNYEMGVTSLQLPAKCPQLPPLPIGQIETLTRRIYDMIFLPTMMSDMLVVK